MDNFITEVVQAAYIYIYLIVVDFITEVVGTDVGKANTLHDFCDVFEAGSEVKVQPLHAGFIHCLLPHHIEIIITNDLHQLIGWQ